MFGEGKLTTWAGIPLEEMTREQLIEALQDCFERLKQFYTPESMRERALGKVQIFKQGNKPKSSWWWS